MPRGQMTTETKDELRQQVAELETALEKECNLYKDQRWGLSMLGITADVEKDPELFKQQVVYTAWRLGIIKKVEG